MLQGVLPAESTVWVDDEFKQDEGSPSERSEGYLRVNVGRAERWSEAIGQVWLAEFRQ